MKDETGKPENGTIVGKTTPPALTVNERLKLTRFWHLKLTHL